MFYYLPEGSKHPFHTGAHSAHNQGDHVIQAACATTQRVLIVDDHDTSRQFMCGTLRKSGLRVRQACSASEAGRMALDWLPHVIVLDVRLAGENGYATAHQIRMRWPSGSRLPRFVMTSADPPDGRSLQALTARGDEFLLKPFSARQLVEAVRGPNRGPLPASGCEAPTSGDLQNLFRAELSARLEALEQCLARPDLPGAKSILHQLIASSALCRQHRLERDLRALYAACRRPIDSSTLARGYLALLASSRDFLATP